MATVIPSRPRRRPLRMLTIAFETTLLFGTGYIVDLLGWHLGHPESGAYVAGSGIGLYGSALAIETAKAFRRRP